MTVNEHERFCAACDPYFEHRRDMRHTYEAPRCKLARPGVKPAPWTDEERKAHDFVAEVARILRDGPPKPDVAFYEELMTDEVV